MKLSSYEKKMLVQNDNDYSRKYSKKEHKMKVNKARKDKHLAHSLFANCE